MTAATQSMPQFMDPTSFNGKLYNFLLNKPEEAKKIGFSSEDIARANFEKKQQQAEDMINRARDAQEAPTVRRRKPSKPAAAVVVPDEQEVDSDDEDDYEMRATDGSDSDEDDSDSDEDDSDSDEDDSDSDEDIIEIVEADAQKSPPAKKSPAKKTANFEDLTNDELKSLCRSAALPTCTKT